MNLFNVSQTETQLRIEKRHSPQFLRAGLFIGALGFFGSGLGQAMREAFDFWGFVSLAALCLFLAVFISQFIPQIATAVRGDNWIFDVSSDTLQRNGKSLGKLSQMYSVRVWEKSNGENTTRHLAIQPASGQPLIISDALNEREWEELFHVAQQISNFTGIKLVHK